MQPFRQKRLCVSGNVSFDDDGGIEDILTTGILQARKQMGHWKLVVKTGHKQKSQIAKVVRDTYFIDFLTVRG